MEEWICNGRYILVVGYPTTRNGSAYDQYCVRNGEMGLNHNIEKVIGKVEVCLQPAISMLYQQVGLIFNHHESKTHPISSRLEGTCL